jgi:hypothetical protein
MKQALNVPLWMDESMKSRYQKFMHHLVHDAFWNAKKILTKYGRKHQEGDVAFEEVILKADLLASCLQPFTKSRNQSGSVGCGKSGVGIAEEALQRHYLIAILDTARVIAMDMQPIVNLKVDMQP